MVYQHGWLANLVRLPDLSFCVKFLFAQVYFHGKILIIKGPSATVRLCRARRGLRDMIKTLPETMKGGRYDQL